MLKNKMDRCTLPWQPPELAFPDSIQSLLPPGVTDPFKRKSYTCCPFANIFQFWLVGLVSNSYPTFETPWTIACQAPLCVGFSRQEYWSGLPFPSPGDLPDPGIRPGSPVLQAVSLPTELWGKPLSIFSDLEMNPTHGASGEKWLNCTKGAFGLDILL